MFPLGFFGRQTLGSIFVQLSFVLVVELRLLWVCALMEMLTTPPHVILHSRFRERCTIFRNTSTLHVYHHHARIILTYSTRQMSHFYRRRLSHFHVRV